MYKKIIFTLIIFLAPIGIIEQNKKDRSPQIINYEYDMIEKNHDLIDRLFKANEGNNITDKRVDKKIYYLKNDIVHLVKNVFMTFKK